MSLDNKNIIDLDLKKDQKILDFTDFQKQNIKFDIELEKDFPAFIDIDRQRVLQIMFNLIGNSVKFTQEGSVALAVEMQHGEKGSFLFQKRMAKSTPHSMVKLHPGLTTRFT